MKALQTIGCWTVAISLAAMVAPQALAQEGDPNKITEQVNQGRATENYRTFPN